MYVVLDADVSSKASTKEIFPLLVDSSLENVVMEGKRIDAVIEIEPPIIIEGSVAESTHKEELGQVRLEDDGQECNEINIADLFEHFLVVGAAPEVLYTYSSCIIVTSMSYSKLFLTCGCSWPMSSRANSPRTRRIPSPIC